MFKTIGQMISVVDGVECGDLEFNIVDTNTPYLQVSLYDVCATSGELHNWQGRKWQLSYHMTRSELVQTCFLAAKVALEHELRERFKWVGQPIFRPHFDIEALWELSKNGKIDKRLKN